MSFDFLLTGRQLIKKYTKDFMQYGYGPRQAKNYAMKLSVIRSKRRPPR